MLVVGAVRTTARDEVRSRGTVSDYGRDEAARTSEASISRTMLPDGREAWLVRKYADVVRILQDHERFSNRAMLTQAGPMPELSPGARDVMSLFALIMSSNDPPDHTRLRRLVQQVFTPRLVEGLRPYVQQLADELLDVVDECAARTGEREMDVIADYAFPLPVTVSTTGRRPPRVLHALPDAGLRSGLLGVLQPLVARPAAGGAAAPRPRRLRPDRASRFSKAASRNRPNPRRLCGPVRQPGVRTPAQPSRGCLMSPIRLRPGWG